MPVRRQLTWALSEKILATDPQALAVEKNGSAYSAFFLPASSVRAGASAAKIFPKTAPVSLLLAGYHHAAQLLFKSNSMQISTKVRQGSKNKSRSSLAY